jgi:hypothetical protein
MKWLFRDNVSAVGFLAVEDAPNLYRVGEE